MASFRKRGSKWQFRIKHKDIFTGEITEKSASGFSTKKEAMLAAREVEAELADGNQEHAITLQAYLTLWLHECKKGTVRKNTFDLHSRNVRNHIIPYFKQIELRKIKPLMYQQFINQLEQTNYSTRTIQIIHSTMSNALEHAKNISMIKSNPTQKVVIKNNKKVKKLKYIESDELPVFLQEAYQYNYTYWFFFKGLIETGMRKGEAAALQWSDVDFKNLTITINKTLDFQTNDPNELFGDPKTYSSVRTISFSKSLADSLHFNLKKQNEDKIALGPLYQHDLNLVFCRTDGSPLPKSSLFNAFNRILKRSGIDQLPIHSLRHTHAVLLLESGADMKYVQSRLGHGSIQITSDIYAHVSKKIDQSSMEKYESYMNKLYE
ncbi:site-specific integrase [Metabacillus idriensis]|uniref:site-specific integrase n=1 Tax=Metabacillus idriensis TaxID=324768 RepID=UPI00203C8F25|nr:site-specific integrase [Metabacillus idriensis]